MAIDSEEPALLGDAPPPATSASATPYRVLARKYRPQSFGELIGQDAMVRTLGNAIARDRLAHAFLLTGVRGVGKTSTARLIAKALNCVGPDGQGGATIDPCGACEPCRAIADGRHIDVVEMDAASHTGVDDIREIVEAVRYAAVSARYKVYIIDEVHMLSRNAFNALLKTLEEPPRHVKFLFATTELAKVPVTVLSRCQRFDLRRIPADTLAAHFAEVSLREGVDAEPEALALIARAAEGSARDGLSLLDQAIAHGQAHDGRTRVEAAAVREMLGLADRGRVRALLALLLAGDPRGALAAVREQYELGVEPAALLRDLLSTVHGITRAKASGEPDPAQSAEERAAFDEWASRLGHAPLHRLWQLLLKGLGEVNAAPVPLEAAEMALLRAIHAAAMPDPGAVLARLESGDPGSARGDAAPARDRPAAMPATLAEMHDLLQANHHHRAALLLHDHGRVLRLAAPDLVLALHPRLTDDALRNLAAALKDATGGTWRVATAEGDGAPSLREQEQAAETGARDAVLASPVVRAALDAFPDAELLGYSAHMQAEA